MWRRQKSQERPPWYRARDYKSNLTEAEKRELDRFRARPAHPAFEYRELPEHVDLYISALEIEIYDLKQAQATGCAIILSLVGAALLYADHFGYAPRASIWDYGLGLALVIVPWIAYRFEWLGNAATFGPASEGILKEWELEYLAKAHFAEKHEPGDPSNV